MSIRFRLFSVGWSVLILLASCSSESPPIAQSEWERLIAVRGEARDLFQSQLLFRYNSVCSSYTGRDSIGWIEANKQAIDQTTSEDNLRLLQKIEDNFPADSEDELKVRRLRHYLLSLRVAEMTSDATQYLQEMRQTARFSLDDRTVDLVTLSATLSESRDRNRRQHAYVLWLEQVRKENAISERVIMLQDSAAVIFGYGDFASLMQDEQELDYAVLEVQARLFLERTDRLYRILADRVVPRIMGIKADKLRGYDLMFLGNLLQSSNFVVTDSLKSSLTTALADMGLSCDSNKGISVVTAGDYQCRPETFPILIPEDIRIVLDRRAGVPEYLHELGHALHYRYTLEREFEFSQLGQNGLKEAYAFLLESLLDEPRFVEQSLRLSGPQLAEFRELHLFGRLLAIRSYCGDFLFEQEVFAGLPDLRSEFERIKQPITGFAWTDIDREQLFQRLDAFSAANYLTAWFAAARLREHLRSEFGENWFESAATGAYLKKLWNAGTRTSTNQLARSLGDTLVSPDAILRELESVPLN